jgi:hypothetical protein
MLYKIENTSLSRVVYRGERRRNFVFHSALGRAIPRRTVSCPNAEAYLDAYLGAAGIGSPSLQDNQQAPAAHQEPDVPGRRAADGQAPGGDGGAAGGDLLPHLQGTGITAYLENGGSIENAQAIAAHESPRTTKLYDRTSDEITLDEVRAHPHLEFRVLKILTPTFKGRRN